MTTRLMRGGCGGTCAAYASNITTASGAAPRARVGVLEDVRWGGQRSLFTNRCDDGSNALETARNHTDAPTAENGSIQLSMLRRKAHHL